MHVSESPSPTSPSSKQLPVSRVDVAEAAVSAEVEMEDGKEKSAEATGEEGAQAGAAAGAEGERDRCDALSSMESAEIAVALSRAAFRWDLDVNFVRANCPRALPALTRPARRLQALQDGGPVAAVGAARGSVPV